MLRFKRVYIEISNLCNLNCSFCSKLRRVPQRLSLQQFRHIVEEIKPYTNFVYFHVKGEPLLHPDLEAFLDVCYQNGLQVNITTNGTLLNERKSLLLCHKALRQVNLSLHAFPEQEQVFEQYVTTAIQFAKEANEKGIYTVLRLWNLDKAGNIDPIGLQIMQQIEHSFALDFSLAEKMGKRKSVQIAKNVFIEWEQEFEWPSLENPFVSDSGFCYGMRHQVAILADGTIVPCCLDANGEAPLGNIFQQSFHEIVQSPTAKAIRHGYEKGIVANELCKRCSFRTKFDAKNG